MLVRPQQYPHFAFDVTWICPRRHISWDVQLTIKMIVPLDPWKTSHPTIGPLYGQLGLCGIWPCKPFNSFPTFNQFLCYGSSLGRDEGKFGQFWMNYKRQVKLQTHHFSGQKCEFQGGYVCCTQVTKPTSWDLGNKIYQHPFPHLNPHHETSNKKSKPLKVPPTRWTVCQL